MLFNLESETSDIISRLEKTGYSESVLASHRRCYDSLQAHFSMSGLAFTMVEAVNWLEECKAGWSYNTYCQYRGALFRLERYLLNGDISRTMCWSIDDFVCCDSASTLPTQLCEMYVEFKNVLAAKFCKTSVYNYSQGCKNFLLFIAERGYANTAELTIDPIIEYASELYCGARRISGQKTGWLAGIVNMLTYIAEHGDIPCCYSSVLPRNTAELQLLPLKVQNPGSAFQPSKALEPLVPQYLSSLDEMRYNNSSKALYANDFTNFFLFLELNHMEYSEEAVEIWLDKQSSRGAFWERRRHTLTLFKHYLRTGSTNKNFVYTWQPLQIDALPEWSRNIILGFVAERQREGLAKTTLTMCRSAGCRFFKFLDFKGISAPQEITPEIVKEFHNADRHATPESKNAYGTKIRQLLSYMAEQKLVPLNLFLAISTQCAPRRTIVSVMSEEMIAAVYDYRENARTALELRNSAMVILGLRMGLRASDIVNLKIENFNWKKKTVSFIQKKTNKAITLHVPIEVGNSVYKYLMNGRPQSGADGTGFVFIRHFAPFGSMETAAPCRYALKNVLSAHGLELPRGQGFHITRKTFATSLLASKNSLDDISNALGHALQATAEVYLERDEDRMRLCPLPFESVGAL